VCLPFGPEESHSECSWDVAFFAFVRWDCDVVSETGSCSVDEASIGKLASALDKKKWEDKQFPLHQKLANMKPAAAVNPSEYAAIYYAGGHGCCVDLPTANTLKRITAQIYESGGVVGADCHGPAIFENLKLSNGVSLLNGKTATGFSDKAEESMGVMKWMRDNNFKTMKQVVELEGGKWTEASNPMSEFTVTEDRVITGMNPASAGKCATEMLALLPREHDIGPLAPGAQVANKGEKGVGSSSSDAEKNKQFAGEARTTKV
jgi:putative intracellular protease/amidase